MLAQADFQRALALALGEFAPAWRIVGDCAPVDRFDASHWGAGSQSFQVTLRHRVTGHLKVLGRRVAYEPSASVHPAVALPLIGAYRHGNAEPLRRYLEEIGVAAVTPGDATHFFRRRETVPSSSVPRSEPAELLAAGLAVAAPVSAVGTVDSADAEVERQAPHSGVSKSWSLSVPRPRWPSRLTVAPRRPRDVPQPAAPSAPRKSVLPATTVETRRPMLSRLRRLLEIWQWRRAAGGGREKKRQARD